MFKRKTRVTITLLRKPRADGSIADVDCTGNAKAWLPMLSSALTVKLRAALKHGLIRQAELEALLENIEQMALEDETNG